MPKLEDMLMLLQNLVIKLLTNRSSKTKEFLHPEYLKILKIEAIELTQNPWENREASCNHQLRWATRLFKEVLKTQAKHIDNMVGNILVLEEWAIVDLRKAKVILMMTMTTREVQMRVAQINSLKQGTTSLLFWSP